MPYNEFGQALGQALPSFTAGPLPEIRVLLGQTVRIEKLDQAHEADLYPIYGPDAPRQNWTYMAIEPFQNREDFHCFFEKMVQSSDPYYLAIVDQASNRAVGTFALMRMDAANRVIEMGWVVYSSDLQRSRLATEAQYLVMRYVFEDLGYRRYEWKCDQLNQASCRAALRLGFQYEGTFRQALVYKGRNRDTAWFSLLDSEWPSRKDALESWLADSNFDEAGRQKTSLSRPE